MLKDINYIHTNLCNNIILLSQILSLIFFFSHKNIRQTLLYQHLSFDCHPLKDKGN